MINSTSTSEFSHFPVMLDEVIKVCSPSKGGIFVDCTFGGGGYSKKILTFSKTKVIALDRDKFILNIAKQLKKKYSKRFTFYQKKFSEVDTIIDKQLADVVIFDPKEVRDNATFKRPHAYSTGFKYVIVNGRIVVENDRHNGAGPGQIIRHIR